MGEPVQNTDREATAYARFIDTFKEKANAVALMSAFTEETQELEDVAFQIFEGFRLETAVGAQLDAIGEIVGLPRYGSEDDAYRLRIRVRVLINIGSGTPDQISEIATRLLAGANTVRFTPRYPASFVLDILGAVTAVQADEVGQAVLDASAAGVGAAVIYSTSPDADTFTFADTSSPEVSSTQGFSDTSQAAGGVMAGLASNT